MKKHLIVILLLGAALKVSAQKEFNRWSIELNGGFNKAMGPLTPGYLSPTLNLGHIDIGARYMINEYVGFKGNLGTGNFREAKGKSPEFTTNYQTITLQGVGNFGKMLNFESFSKKLGLIGHLGAGGGRIDYKEPATYSLEPEYYYLITTGLTSLFNLSDRVALAGDISVNINGRQTYTLDGNYYNALDQPNPPSNPFVHATGTWWTGTLGMNFYLGKAEKHADWYFADEKYATKTELSEAITEIKDMLKDSDGDGIPDYLDKEPNTSSGARVNSLGITLDSDGDGTPDHLDKCPFQPGPSSLNGCPSEVEILNEVDYLKKAINDGYVNVYFAFDSSKPLGYSVSAAQFVSNFLKRNPGVRMEIKGYADELGTENYNMKLSEKRAKAVYDLLISSGVDAARLSFKGYGEDTSVDKASPEARQLARRTSFQIL
jgi:OOP family OmpA-OmpF porin